VRQPSGKRVTAYALEGDLDPTTVVSNEFTLEWPRGSGVLRSFPEVDRAEWFPLDVARDKLVPGQVPLLDLLADLVGGRGAAPG
jgi:predicted NUDIX family NTP pyrophosphohydrolase